MSDAPSCPSSHKSIFIPLIQVDDARCGPELLPPAATERLEPIQSQGSFCAPAFSQAGLAAGAGQRSAFPQARICFCAGCVVSKCSDGQAP